MGLDVNKLHTEICGNDVFFTYDGNIASGQINIILEKVEEKLVSASISVKVRRKILNIMVESLQNLFHHSDDVPEDLVQTYGKRYGMIVITRKDDDFHITVGNFVSSDKVKYLSEKIEKINSLTENELKEMYKFILNYQKLSSKGGGGLGLIDMARKSDKKLEYSFYPYNEKYCFYRLDIFVSNLESNKI
jgi:hypothetical protein